MLCHFSLAQIENTIIVAVNQEYLDSGQSIELRKGDHIAIIPPLSGG
jgi:molybdopterin converting factor small subunit